MPDEIDEILAELRKELNPSGDESTEKELVFFSDFFFKYLPDSDFCQDCVEKEGLVLKCEKYLDEEGNFTEICPVRIKLNERRSSE